MVSVERKRKRIEAEAGKTMEEMHIQATAEAEAQRVINALEALGEDVPPMLASLANSLRTANTLKRWGYGIVRTDSDGNVEPSELHAASIARGRVALALTERVINADPRCKLAQYIGQALPAEAARTIADGLLNPTAELQAIRTQVSANRRASRAIDTIAAVTEDLSVTPDIQRDILKSVESDAGTTSAAGIAEAMRLRKESRAERAEALATLRGLLRFQEDNPTLVSPEIQSKIDTGMVRFPNAKPLPRKR